jgi:hypothetical protein
MRRALVSRHKQIETHLAMAERHIVETESHLAHQRHIVAKCVVVVTLERQKWQRKF